MEFALDKFLTQTREAIIAQWVERLKTEAGQQYADRPREELFETVTAAFEANTRMLIHDDYAPIDKFIRRITKMRLESGFLLSDVQRAFEIFRSITLPLVAAETNARELFDTITRIDQCLTYTIYRFSDHFQRMHQQKILEHNRQLEGKVRARTAALAESERKYKTLVEEINDGYIVVQNENVVFANPAFCQMHGYESSEVIGRKFHEFIDSGSRDQVIRLYATNTRKKRAPRSFEYKRLTREGNSFPTEILAKTTYYDNKLSSIGICRDITQRVRLERKIRESERMAYIGKVTTSLSHEIRNPLSSVKMNLQILKKNHLLQGNDKRRIDISVREVKRLEHILKELLDYAKPIHLKFQRFALDEIIRTAIGLLEIKFQEKEVVVVADLDAHAPLICADKEKIEQAVINLLLNALEASGPGGEIRVATRHPPQQGDDFEIVISDQGCGIPPQHFADILEPFFTTKSKGTGLGLSNVQQIVQAHRGRIEVENLEPCGAVFRLHLHSNGR